jgi:two-component system, chemotaxis family, response regulator Rcp1
MTGKVARILLIEDNPGDVKLIKEVLRLRGIPYELTHCETVDAALHLVEHCGVDGEKVPDLMLLDYNLPRGEARTVLQATSNNPALAQMRKAVVTSSLAPKDREDALRFGAEAFVCKPADLDTFLTDVGEMIAKLLERA